MPMPESLKIRARDTYDDEQKLIVRGVNDDIEEEKFWREMDRIHGMTIEEEPNSSTK